MAAVVNRRILLLLYLRRRMRRCKKYRKRFWVRPIFERRQQHGEYFRLVKEMKEEDHESYFAYFRMLPRHFDFLLSLVAPLISKCSTRRDAISPSERLALTLRYLASGDSPQSLSFSYRIGMTTVHKIIGEVTEAIWSTLFKKGYIKAPESSFEWEKVAEEFEKRWNFPHCCGAMDGKHIRMQAPPSAGSRYFNYKLWHSIVLLAVVSADYTFLLVDVGDCGRHSDGGVLQNSQFGEALVTNQLGLPCPKPLAGAHPNGKIPYMFVADEAFPLRCNIMRPYPGKHLTEEKRVLNYHLSRARRIVGNAFGIAASRFRILRQEIIAHPSKVEAISKAVVAWHNYLIISEQHVPAGSRMYCPPGFVDNEDR
ncbi:protein ALP1-like [Xenia sp. Carnegie-2017]|uniref:protein ALP1-like n=1 Tax=Xenia sp. Carnegie-2017 TaxID=2897299 RepID=UPI001F0364A6|nr:protein ALP1-like [Xenia sp. Carnegie-2017]